jgi:hydroxymethylpyrimidine pyrophosphatase-like HAD family hydrolase
MYKAVIFDIDNTILYQTNRSPFDWSDLSGDILIPEMGHLIDVFSKDEFYVILLTGRPESVRTQTEKWLEKNCVNYSELIMKEGNQYEKSYITKEKSLLEIQKKFKVELVFEDDRKCADMYVRNGVITLQPQNFLIK